MMRVERLPRVRVVGLLVLLLAILQLTIPPLHTASRRDQHRRQQSADHGTKVGGTSRTMSRSEEAGPRRGRDDDDAPSSPRPHPLSSFPSKSSSSSLIPILDDVNILIVTDVHSWVASHSPHHDPYLNADYGTVLSFYERMQRLCETRDQDLFFVNNGDYVDGTGLSRDPPDELVRILERMPWDAVNIGNHEVHYDRTMEAAASRPGGFVHSLGGRYLTSNVVWKESGQPVGSRYRFLRGERATLLTFGFLYEYEFPASSAVVEKVADAVRSDWFVSVVSGKEGAFDAVLVLAHMDVSDPLVTVILGAVRDMCGEEMRVLFVTGHTHIQGYEILDGRSVSVEAGKYLDTVGFVSFPITSAGDAKTKEFAGGTNDEEAIDEDATTGKDDAMVSLARTVNGSNATGTAELPEAGFRHAFLDANFDVLRNALDDDTRNANLTTANGQRLSDLIKTISASMGLNDVLGCAPHTYLLNTTVAELDDENSLWGLYFREVVPTQLMGRNASQVFVQDGGGLRYDLYEGTVTVGDLIAASPINDTILLVAERIGGGALLGVFDDHPDLYFWGTGDGEVVVDEGLYDVYSVEFDAYMLAPALAGALNRTVEPRTMSGGNRTQIDLWTDYITERWECPSPSSSTSTAEAVTHSIYSEEQRVQMVLGVLVAVLYGVGLAVIYWIVLCFTWRIGGKPSRGRTSLATCCKYKVCTKMGATSSNDEDDSQTCYDDEDGQIAQESTPSGGTARLHEIT